MKRFNKLFFILLVCIFIFSGCNSNANTSSISTTESINSSSERISYTSLDSSISQSSQQSSQSESSSSSFIQTQISVASQQSNSSESSLTQSSSSYKVTESTYTLKVKYHAVNQDESKNTVMYYSTEYGFSAYELADKRTGYTFIGLEYSGVLYTMSLVEVDYVNGITKLSNAIKMQQQKQLEVTAVWECEFTSYIFNFKAYCEYQREGTPVETRWGVYNNSSNKEENNLVEKMDVSVVFNDKEENYYYDLEDNIFNILFSDSEAKYYTKEGAEVEFNGDVLIIDVASNSEYTIHGIEDAYTFRNAMGTLKYKLGSLDNTNQVTIGFMFDIVA